MVCVYVCVGKWEGWCVGGVCVGGWVNGGGCVWVGGCDFGRLICLRHKLLTAEVIVVAMVTGMTDENGWQEIHQVSHTQTQTHTRHQSYLYDPSLHTFVGVIV